MNIHENHVHSISKYPTWAKRKDVNHFKNNIKIDISILYLQFYNLQCGQETKQNRQISNFTINIKGNFSTSAYSISNVHQNKLNHLANIVIPGYALYNRQTHPDYPDHMQKKVSYWTRHISPAHVDDPD